MQIALYRIPGTGGSPYVREVDIGTVMDYVRLSEIVDVEFPLIPPADTRVAEIEALDRKERNLIAEHNARMTDINRAREKIRANNGAL